MYSRSGANSAQSRLHNAELETKARITMAIGGGTAALMLFFLILLLALAPALEGFLLIGSLLLISAVAAGLAYYGIVVPGAWVYLIGFNGLLVYSMWTNPDPTSATPYFLGISVVLSGILIRPGAPFVTAAISAAAIGGMVALAPPPVTDAAIPAWLGPVLIPVSLLFLLATVAWIYGSEIRRTIGNLRGVAHETREGINVLGASASEILAATSQITARSAETAAAISQTSTTVDEVRQAAHLSAEKAKRVSESSQKAADVGLTGKGLTENTAAVMQRIQGQMGEVAESIVRLSEQSQAIGEIIATVTDLAEQSNLLRSMRPSKQPRPGSMGGGLRWWRRRCGAWRSSRSRRRRKCG